MTKPEKNRGHEKHYQDLLTILQNKDLSLLAGRLGLPVNSCGEVEIPFSGRTYLISGKEVKRSDGKQFLHVTGSALIHYLLKSASATPAGKFISINELSGPWLKDGSFSKSALERPIINRFAKKIPDLFRAAESIGGQQGGISGSGSISLIFPLLPNILVQLIFYDQDDEFPARTTLLVDANATEFIDFEALAALLSIFVQHLANE